METPFLNTQEEEKIIEAIKAAEKVTSGEIKIHIEKKCNGNPLKKAAEVFHKLELHKTEKRNAVLIYIASDSHKFAVLGDEGINAIAGQNFWDNVVSIMMKHFEINQPAEAIIKGIEETGKLLAKHFPYQNDDVNEIGNDISYS